MRLTGATAAILVALAAVAALYGRTLDYGFDYDDYHFVRPYSVSEIAAAFHGPWDPAGIEVPFFRPSPSRCSRRVSSSSA